MQKKSFGLWTAYTYTLSERARFHADLERVGRTHQVQEIAIANGYAFQAKPLRRVGGNPMRRTNSGYVVIKGARVGGGYLYWTGDAWERGKANAKRYGTKPAAMRQLSALRKVGETDIGLAFYSAAFGTTIGDVGGNPRDARDWGLLAGHRVILAGNQGTVTKITSRGVVTVQLD